MCIAAICSIILIFNFMGCRNYEKEEKDALEYLSNKYGEEFELDGKFESVYGDEFYQSPIKSTKAWVKNNPNEVFTIEYYPDGDYKDNYQNIIMKPFIDEYFTSVIGKYWTKYNVYTKISPGCINEKYESNEYFKFLTDGKVDVSLSIYLKYDNNFNIEKEIYNIKSLCDFFSDSGLNGYISITYSTRDILKNEVDCDLWKKLDEEGKTKTFYSTKCGSEVEDSSTEININTIRQQLENNLVEDK